MSPEVLSIRSELMRHVKTHLGKTELAYHGPASIERGAVGSPEKRHSDDVDVGGADRKRRKNDSRKSNSPNQTTSDFNNQTSEHPRDDLNGLAALVSACSQQVPPSVEAAPVGTPDLVSSATQPHGSMAEPCGVDPLVGGSAVDGTDQEQLTPSDLQHGQYMLQLSQHQFTDLPESPNTFNAADSWDSPGWLDIIDLPLFSAQPHFDMFGNPEQMRESHSVEA
jgi:hypothetical protein